MRRVDVEIYDLSPAQPRRSPILQQAVGRSWAALAFGLPAYRYALSRASAAVGQQWPGDRCTRWMAPQIGGRDSSSGAGVGALRGVWDTG